MEDYLNTTIMFYWIVFWCAWLVYKVLRLLKKRVRICVTQPAWNLTKLVLFERIFITDHILVKEFMQNSSFNPQLNKTLKKICIVKFSLFTTRVTRAQGSCHSCHQIGHFLSAIGDLRRFHENFMKFVSICLITSSFVLRLVRESKWYMYSLFMKLAQ